MKVFISSPYSQLEEERRATADALAADHEVVAMENFGSTGLAPLDTCLEALRPCTACILILAGRYGSRAPSVDISYTEAEFEFAQANGIRVYAYVAEDFEELVENAPQDERDKLSQREFAAKVERELVVDQNRFSTPAELASAAKRDISRWSHNQSRPAFPKKRHSVDRLLAYASKSVARTTARLYPMPIVLVDIGAAHLQSTPPPQRGRISRKVHEIYADLDSRDFGVVRFNEISVTDTRDGSPLDQRLAALMPSPALIVCIVGKKSELERLELFTDVGAERVLWKPSELDVDFDSFEPSYVDDYSPEELSNCSVALAIESYVDTRISEHALGVLIESRN